MGHKKYYSLLNEFFHEFSDPVLLTKAEIYQYVGDEDIFTWETQDRERDIHAAEKAWEKSKEMIEASRGKNPAYDMVILDELNIVLRYDSLPLAEVVAFLKNKPENLHVVVTGRNAKEELIDIADLVTEMTQIKHPFRSGVKAQVGIEF